MRMITPSDKTVIKYLVSFLSIQIAISLLLYATITIIFKYPVSELINFRIDYTLPFWIIGALFSIVQIVLTSFIVWKWFDAKLPSPTVFHWSIAYFCYFFLFGGLIILFAFYEPSLWQNIVSSPNLTPYLISFLALFFLFPSFSFILTFYRIIGLLLLILFPDVTGESAFMLVMMMLGLFVLSLIFIFPVVPIFLFYIEMMVFERLRSAYKEELHS